MSSGIANSIHLTEEVPWNSPFFSLQPCTFLLSVSHRGFDASSTSSFSLNSNLTNLSLQCVPISHSFWKFGVSTGFFHTQPASGSACRDSQFAAGILHERCSRHWTGNSISTLEIPCAPHQKSHLIAANSGAIRGRVCTLPYHSPTGSHLCWASHLFHIQFKAACLGILHGPFPAIFTDLVPTFSFTEVPGKISIDFNWTGCWLFFFFFFPLWQWNIPTTKFKATGMWLSCFVEKLKITPDFGEICKQETFGVFSSWNTHQLCNGFECETAGNYSLRFARTGYGKTKLLFAFYVTLSILLNCLLLFSSQGKRKL